MGGCFPCVGSSNKGGNGVKEVIKKDSLKESSVGLSHHVDRVSSGIVSRYFLGLFLLVLGQDWIFIYIWLSFYLSV